MLRDVHIGAMLHTVNASDKTHLAGQSGRPELAFILGMGRSGTNFLLDLLDLSERTHCRNEPDELPGGSLESWGRWKIHSAKRTGDEHWREIARAASCGGERDRPAPPWKSWLHKRSSGPLKALSKKGLRKLMPGLRGAEFKFPETLVKHEELSSSLHVFKINAAPSVAELFLREQTSPTERSPQVVHIVRNPAGFLRSWRRRWLEKHDLDEVLKANRARIQEVLENDPTGGSFMSDFKEPDVFESELLFWRYCTQRIREAGHGRDNYTEVSYDKLASDPAASLRLIFNELLLPWTPDVEERVAAMTNDSVAIANAFQAELDEETRELLKRTLGPELAEEFDLCS